MRTQATEEEPSPGGRTFRCRVTKVVIDPSVADMSDDAEAALERGNTADGLRLLRRLWRATHDPWHLARIGCALFRTHKLRRARVALECAARMRPFHILVGSLLIQVAQAQGDHEGALRARDYTITNRGDDLPPEPW
jgi:hypothetical protein